MHTRIITAYRRSTAERSLPLVVPDLRGETAQQSSCDDHTTFLFRCSDSLSHTTAAANERLCVRSGKSTAKLFFLQSKYPNCSNGRRQCAFLWPTSNRMTIARCGGKRESF